MQPLNLVDVLPQFFLNGSGQDGLAILSALAIPHENLPSRKIEIFDPRRQCFVEPQPGSIQQFRDQRRRSPHLRHEVLYLLSRQYDGQPFRPLGVDRHLHPIRLFALKPGRREIAGRRAPDSAWTQTHGIPTPSTPRNGSPPRRTLRFITAYQSRSRQGGGFWAWSAGRR